MANVLLVIGDAAGLAYNISGEGIRPAVFSGLIAAETILQASVSYSPHDLKAYENRIRGHFGKPYSRNSLRLASFLPSLPALIGKQVLRSRGLTGLVLARGCFLRKLIEV